MLSLICDIPFHFFKKKSHMKIYPLYTKLFILNTVFYKTYQSSHYLLLRTAKLKKGKEKKSQTLNDKYVPFCIGFSEINLYSNL